MELLSQEKTVKVLDHGHVALYQHCASDLSVVNSARISFDTRHDEIEEGDDKLIHFLLKNRHGCYDDRTEVLTNEGWKFWPTVSGNETFATRNRYGELEFQPALKTVHKEYKGEMIGFKGQSLDLLVTPEHNVLSSAVTTLSERQNRNFYLTPAALVFNKNHRHVKWATWSGYRPFTLSSFRPLPLLQLMGLFIGDGHLLKQNYLSFHISKDREINFLKRCCDKLQFEVLLHGNSYNVKIPEFLWNEFDECYENREKVIPSWVMKLDYQYLLSLVDGLMNSDGSTSERLNADRWSYSTTSKKLADQIQEIALKIGSSASVRPHKFDNNHFGKKDRWRITFFANRNCEPELGRTKSDKDTQMGIEKYNGTIHCVEVPNGTLFVRRNGYPVWSGNTPFEHNMFTFDVKAPIFVFREWHRHRIASINEMSARYTELPGEWYIPEPENVRMRVGRPGAYTYEPHSNPGQFLHYLSLQCAESYSLYQESLKRNIAPEQARLFLHVNHYSHMFWTVNARSLMNFLRLRNAPTAQWEIQQYAKAIEDIFSIMMPITYHAFEEGGRIAP